MKRLLLCASTLVASTAYGQAPAQQATGLEQQPAKAAPNEASPIDQETPAENAAAPVPAAPAAEVAPVRQQRYGLNPDSSLAFTTDMLNEKEQEYTFSLIQLNADQFDKIDVLEQETKARLNVGTVGAYFSPEPGKVRVGLRFEQAEIGGKFKLSDVSDPANPQRLYEIKLKQKDSIPHLLIAFQATDYIRLAIDLFNTTRQQQSAGITDDLSYGSYEASALVDLPANYSLGISFKPHVSIHEAITFEQEREISMLLRRDLADSVAQGKVTHTAYSKMNSAYKDVYTIELGGERRIFDKVAIGGLLKYEPAYYKKSSDIASTNIATLVSSVYGRFRLQDNLTLTGELIRWKSAEVNKKVEGVEYIANAIVTGGAISLSYTNL